jgi:hypothetical protein
MDEAQALQLFAKGGPGTLQTMLARLKTDQPAALTLSVGRSGFYLRDAIIDYLLNLIALAPSSYVVFVDDATKTFIGGASARQVLSILKDDSTWKRFMDELQRQEPHPFAGMGFLVTQFLTPSDTNATAPQKFGDQCRRPGDRAGGRQATDRRGRPKPAYCQADGKLAG